MVPSADAYGPATVDERRFSRLLFGAVAIPVVALAVLAGLLAWQVTHLISLSHWVDHTDRVISDAREVERLMVDMETGVRGYLLSGMPQFLQPWTSAERAIDSEFDELAKEVAGEPAQERRVAILRDSLDSWMRDARTAIDTHDRDVVNMEHRKGLMDGMRAQAATLESAEESLRADHERVAESGATLMLGGALGGTLVFGGALGLASRHQMLRVADLYRSAVDLRELVLQSVGDGIYGVDTAGRISFLNPAGASMLGCEPRQALGANAHELFHHSTPDGRPYPMQRCPIYMAFRDGAVHHVEDEVFWRSDGSSFPVSYVSTPIRRVATLEGAVVSFRDMSRQKQREAERQELLEHAQEGVRARDHVLGVAAHELRTPMTSLLMHTELLVKLCERDGADVPWEEVGRRVDVCRRQVKRLNRLVDELLDASRIRAQRVEVHREEVDLAQLVRNGLADLAPSFEEAGCSLALDVGESPKGFWDPDKVERILFNLVCNALQFGAGKPVEVSVRDEGGRAVVSVRDHGTGVSDEERDRIFRPLEHADVAHHTRGLGLGLYISRGLAQAMGGDVTLADTPGPGARFRLWLPK